MIHYNIMETENADFHIVWITPANEDRIMVLTNRNYDFLIKGLGK